MLTYRSSVVIARPADVVFPYLVEPQRQALWSDVPMRQLTDGPLRTGSRLEVTFGKGPLKAVIGLELTEVAPAQRMAWRSFSGPIGWRGSYELTATDPATTSVAQDGELTFHGLWRLVEPIVSGEIRSGEVKELERLKEVVEAG
ncbi:MAG TPA: SRPBCC family protein [Candidatus Limnocylindria bacterium]|nr:SRPBCC family protein [Candidatus Limnocylindria bacterium]